MSTYLTSKLKKFVSEYPNFNKDLEKTMFLQRVALQMVKLQNDSGLALEDFAREVELQILTFQGCKAGNTTQRYSLYWILLKDVGIS